GTGLTKWTSSEPLPRGQTVRRDGRASFCGPTPRRIPAADREPTGGERGGRARTGVRAGRDVHDGGRAGLWLSTARGGRGGLIHRDILRNERAVRAVRYGHRAPGARPGRLRDAGVAGRRLSAGAGGASGGVRELGGCGGVRGVGRVTAADGGGMGESGAGP